MNKIFSDPLKHQWPSIVLPVSFFLVICGIVFQAGRMSSDISTIKAQQDSNTQNISAISQRWAEHDLTVNEQLAQIQQTLTDMRRESTVRDNRQSSH